MVSARPVAGRGGQEGVVPGRVFGPRSVEELLGGGTGEGNRAHDGEDVLVRTDGAGVGTALCARWNGIDSVR